jgi:hypothetical protein
MLKSYSNVLVSEIAMLSNSGTGRAVSLGTTEGLNLVNTTTFQTYQPLTVPVGRITLGRIINVTGSLLDPYFDQFVSVSQAALAEVRSVRENAKECNRECYGSLPYLPSMSSDNDRVSTRSFNLIDLRPSETLILLLSVLEAKTQLTNTNPVHILQLLITTLEHLTIPTYQNRTETECLKSLKSISNAAMILNYLAPKVTESNEIETASS